MKALDSYAPKSRTALTIFSRTPPVPRDELVELSREHLVPLRRFLERDPINNLFALSWLENYGVTSSREGMFHFLGVFGSRGDVEAMALVITRRLVLLDSCNQIWAKRMGQWYAERKYHVHHVVSVRHLVDAFWGSMIEHSTLPSLQERLSSPQFMYVLKREHWLGAATTPPKTGLRLARLSDLEAVFLASADMHQEETMENPLDDNPELFQNHVRHRIETGRTFVWFEDHRLLFKADISAQSAYGAQISGVYTAPSSRGKGIATKAMRALCHIWMKKGVPRVTLYVNQSNIPARRVYEKVGFSFHSHYKTVFVEK